MHFHMQEWARCLFRIHFLSLQYKFLPGGRYAPAHLAHIKVAQILRTYIKLSSLLSEDSKEESFNSKLLRQIRTMERNVEVHIFKAKRKVGVLLK